MKLLITGIPGTGKTSIGKYLQDEKGYEHFDIEATFKKYGKEGMPMLREFLNKRADNKVMTWGFIPTEHDNQVKEFQNLGYEMIWFDGDRDSARREFLKRGTVSEDLFDLQLSKIASMDLNKFTPIKINTFDKNGEFLTHEEIFNLIKSGHI